MKTSEILPITSREAPVELRLFEITLFITLLTVWFWTGYGFFMGYQWLMMMIFGAASVIYTGIYVAQKIGASFRKVSWTYYSCMFVLMALAWLPSGGLNGAIVNMLVLVFSSGLLVLRPKDFRFFIVMALGLVIGLSAYEFIEPEAAAKYQDPNRMMLDISVSNVFMLVVLGITMFIFKREYSRDRRRLRIANGHLELQKVKAQSADKAKTTFLTNISHEMRTPLNGVMGSLDLLQRSDLSSEQYEIVKNLSYSGQILHGLISDVLDITLIDDRKLVLNDAEFNLKQLIDGVVKFFQPEITRKSDKVYLSSQYDFSIPDRLTGDSNRVRQVLINLVKNAINFTEKGHISISAELVGADDAHANVKISVCDTGSGIHPKQKHLIFEEFHREESTGGLDGAGLGLSICKKIVEAMGGRIGLDHTSSEGSCFSYIVPFKVDQEEDLQTLSIDAQFAFAALSVLIVEDQQINQLITKKVLKNMGIMNIDIADNGEKAIEMARNKNYDFIFMDIRMPLKDGVEATREILNAELQHPPVVIALTANALKSDQEACFEAGMSDFICKPFNSDRLKSSMMKFI